MDQTPELTPIRHHEPKDVTSSDTEAHSKGRTAAKVASRPVMIKVKETRISANGDKTQKPMRPKQSVQTSNRSEKKMNDLQGITDFVEWVEDGLEQISSNVESGTGHNKDLAQNFQSHTINHESPNQKIIFVSKPCNCSKDASLESSGSAPPTNQQFSSISILNKNVDLVDEKTVILDSKKTLKITLPGEIPMQAKSTTEQNARTVTIKSLYEGVTHDIRVPKGHTIGGQKSYRLMGGKCVTFYGVGDTWYPV